MGGGTGACRRRVLGSYATYFETHDRRGVAPGNVSLHGRGRTDLYSTGVVLFECVTGRPVFETRGLAALLGHHLKDAPPDPSSLNPEVPAALSRIILRALARRPEDRWPSAADFLHAVEPV